MAVVIGVCQQIAQIISVSLLIDITRVVDNLHVVPSVFHSTPDALWQEFKQERDVAIRSFLF